MNLKEAIRENQKQHQLFRIIRRCITQTEREMKTKRIEEENKRREAKLKLKELNKKKYASRNNKRGN